MQKIIIILGLLVLALFSCKNNCENGYESFDDMCICPDGKFEGFGECSTLKENELYGISSCGGFADTIFMELLEKTDNSTYRVQIRRTMTSFRITSLPYIEYPTFDSLYATEVADSGLFGHRSIAGIGLCSAQVFGRLTSEEFNGSIKWYKVSPEWDDGTHVLVDSCALSLVR